ncbi:MAG: DUF4281 domain-containing protein [Cytophagia bacterium]|nr:MAG: DUF4281 domain-containing protein [Cytophagia bacterium]TAH29671.1 MAG: DUF4281 domain-containing protein [Cytophagales bacterium]
MTASFVFNVLNFLILPVWVMYIFAPKWYLTQLHLKYPIVPILLAIAYALIIIPNLGLIGEANFSSLEGIKKLFSNMKSDWFVTAAWFHYLCFDLWVGGWIVSDSQANQLKSIYIIPCLLFTFMLGPVGFLGYWILKIISKQSVENQ